MVGLIQEVHIVAGEGVPPLVVETLNLPLIADYLLEFGITSDNLLDLIVVPILVAPGLSGVQHHKPDDLLLPWTQLHL